MATAQNLPQLLLYRVMSGAGAATVILAGQVMVGDLSTPANRGRLMSVYQGFFLIGVGIGPAPGGFLADHFGLRTPFFAYAAFSALASLVALFLITETRPATPLAGSAGVGAATPDSPADTVTVRDVVLSPAFLLISAVSFVQFFARTGAVFNVVPLLGDERIGLSPSQIGLTLTLVSLLNIAMLYHTGVFSDRYGRKVVIWPSTVLSGLSMIGYALSNSYGAFLASAALWGVASGISGPSPGAYIADLAPAAVRGRVFGLYRTIADAGYVVGPLLLGWLLAATGYTTPLVLTAALFILAGGAFALFAPETHRGSRPMGSSVRSRDAVKGGLER
jgi:MFS family permease